jgi:hypothetical protein
MAERIYIFKRFERFWHWSQAALIMFMMLTASNPRHLFTFRLRRGGQLPRHSGMDADRPVDFRRLLAPDDR